MSGFLYSRKTESTYARYVVSGLNTVVTGQGLSLVDFQRKPGQVLVKKSFEPGGKLEDMTLPGSACSAGRKKNDMPLSVAEEVLGMIKTVKMRQRRKVR